MFEVYLSVGSSIQVRLSLGRQYIVHNDEDVFPRSNIP